MSALAIVERIQGRPADEPARVPYLMIESGDSGIPEEFKNGMSEIAAGRMVDLDAAVNERSPGGQ